MESQLEAGTSIATRAHGTPKVLMFIEARTVNGAAKSLLNFWDTINGAGWHQPQSTLSLSFATFDRGKVSGECSATEFLEAVRRRGIDAHVIRERYRFDRKLVSSVRNIIEQTAPDIVQTNNVKSHFLIKTAGIQKHSRWVAFHHGYTRTDLKMRCYNRLDRWSLPSADRVITVCGAFKSQLVASGISSERVHVLHNAGLAMAPLPAANLDSVKARLGIPRESKILLTIGRLSSEKGHADLIDSMGWIKQLRPSLACKLVLVGFGPEGQRLQARTLKRGLQSHVIFASNEPDVLPFYRMADVFVLASHTEGSPHVIFEAMGAGVPIIATRVGGIPEILEDGQTGILSPSRAPELLARAILRMLDLKAAASTYAANAYQVLQTRFSPEVHARSLLDIYSEVLQ